MAKYRFVVTIDGKIVAKQFSSIEDGKKWQKEMWETLSDKDLDGEIWKEIPNLSRYMVSNYGRVKSIRYKNTLASRIISATDNGDGYCQSMFQSDSGKYVTRKIHVLVCLCFLGEKPHNCEINHKNGIKSDNRLENLEYVTHSENCKHSFDIGLQKAKRGTLNGMAKLTWEQVEMIRNAKKTGGMFWGRERIAKELGMNAKHIQRIANGNDLWKVD